MTTTEPTALPAWRTLDTTTTPAWLNLDELCPPEMREEGQQLLVEVRAIIEALTPLVPRAERLIQASNQRFKAVLADVERFTGPDAAQEISNGLGRMLGALSGADELYYQMSVLGLEDQVESAGTEVED